MPQTAQTPKQEAAEVLRNLPDDSSLEDIQYHLYVLEKIRKGREDIATGRACTQEEAKQRLDRWLAG
jgi:predicted transcriptional regulator